MKVSRRDFLRYCGLSATALGLTKTDLLAMDSLLASSNAPAVLWIQGSSCCGDSISLINRISATVPKTVDELLLNSIDLIFHPNLMGPSGDEAVAAIRSVNNYILVIEGGVPTAYNGMGCTVWTENDVDVTFGDAIRSLAPNAIKIICVGQCACFGGIPASGSNPVKVVSVPSYLAMPTINIAGCPPHPDWMIGTIAQLLAGKTVPLDKYGRPTQFFGRTVHSRCPLRETEEAKTFGVRNRCLKELGCRGPETYCNCPDMKWNNGVSWCVQAGGPCIGCTNPTFPGAGSLYSEEDGEGDDD